MRHQMKAKHWLGIVSTLALAAGCAHHRDVRPGVSGENRVMLRGPDRHELEREAIRQANHFCGEQKKTAAFVSEGAQYTGDMDEATHNTVRRASQAASILGGGMAGVGEGRTSTAGEVLAGAGVVGGVMTGGEAYTVEMKFRCQ
jgi:hypothetical protein